MSKLSADFEDLKVELEIVPEAEDLDISIFYVEDGEIVTALNTTWSQLQRLQEFIGRMFEEGRIV